MIEELALYWELFRDSLLAGIALAWLLGQVGVLVVARDEIFLGVAIAQASTLGVAIAVAFEPALDALLSPDVAGVLFAIVFSVLAAVVSRPFESDGRSGGISRGSRQAASGWVYLFASSLTILIVSRSARGEEVLHELFFSASIVVVSSLEVVSFAVLAVLGTVAFFLGRREVLLLVSDPQMARAVGVNPRRVSPLIGIWLGISIGLAIRASGLLFTFGALVLPALIARSLVREMRTLFFLAPLIAVPAVASSFLAAHFADLPPGQLATGVLAALVPLAWCLGRVLRR